MVMMCLCSYGAVAQTDVDTLMRISPNAVDELVKYKARDSVAMDLQSRRAFLYSEGKIDYGEMKLEEILDQAFGRRLVRHVLNSEYSPSTSFRRLSART